MSTAPVPTRLLPLRGFVNLRDVGGYGVAGGGTTRWGTLLRADMPVDADQRELVALVEQGITTVIDLRDDDEVVLAPSPYGAAGLTVLRHGVLDGSAASVVAQQWTLDDLYERLLASSGRRFAAAAASIATAPGGVIVHCTAGKDRTGLTVGLALAAVGVGHDDVVADYSRSQDLLAGAWFEAKLRELESHHGGDLRHLAGLLIGSPATAMQRSLAYVDDTWGGAAGYLTAHGMTSEQLELLTAKLTEPGPATSSPTTPTTTGTTP